MRSVCFSARVLQNLKHLSRRYEAEVDWAAFEELYRRRAEGEDIRASRDLQRNFQNPETDVEHRTAAYIGQYLKKKRDDWEQEVFAQRRRVAEAEESLAKRETKKAREDIGCVWPIPRCIASFIPEPQPILAAVRSSCLRPALYYLIRP